MNNTLIARVLSIVSVGTLAACTSVGVVGYPGEYIATKSPSHVWVTQAGQTGLKDLYNPQLHGDTLVGFDKGGAYFEMPIGDVQLMKAPVAAPAKTALFAATVAVGTALIITHVQGGVDYCANFAPGAANNGLVQPCGTIYGKPVNPTGG